MHNFYILGKWLVFEILRLVGNEIKICVQFVESYEHVPDLFS